MWVLWKEPDTNQLKNVTEFSVIFHWEEFSLPQMGKTWPLSTTSMLKRGPPVGKLGLMLLGGGSHGSPPLPPQPTADQKSTGVLCPGFFALRPMSFLFARCAHQPFWYQYHLTVFWRDVWRKSLGPPEWFVAYLLGWLGSVWESKASQLIAVKPC